MADHPEPLILIVAYRAEEHLSACLAALGSLAHVNVVDNEAAESTRQVVQAAGARYLASPANVGFAAAVNLGLRTFWDGTTDVLLLNPDARISRGDVVLLQATLHAVGTRCAAVGPRIVDERGNEQLAAWPMPSPAQVWFDALGAASLWRGRRFITGAVLMLRGEALADLGGFDENYFLYAEEADWQMRAQRAGWKVTTTNDVEVAHVGGASSTDEALRHFLFHTSSQKFARRWYGPLGSRVMTAGSIVAALRRSFMGSAEAREDNRRTLRFLLGASRRPPTPREIS